MIESLLISLILTLVIELGVAICLGVRGKNDLLLVVLVNTLTNPVVVFLANLSFLLGASWIAVRVAIIIVLEILAFLVEGFLLKKFLQNKKIQPYLLALLMNLISFGSGIVINIMR